MDARIIEALSAGTPLAEVCREEGMPHPSTVRDWMDADEGFSRAIARAREDGEEQIGVECLVIADADPAMKATEAGLAIDPADVANRKLRIETRLKLLAKWNPRKWGDKVEHEHKGKVTLESLVVGDAGQE